MLNSFCSGIIAAMGWRGCAIEARTRRKRALGEAERSLRESSGGPARNFTGGSATRERRQNF
jgi:hypothetical protein